MGPPIDFTRFNPQQFPPELITQARAVWSVRVQTEYRSIQVMTQFAQEVLGAGDPLDVYAGAVDAIADEIRHTGLCVQMLEALGGTPMYPDPLTPKEPTEFLSLPMAQRAAATAISMLALEPLIAAYQPILDRLSDTEREMNRYPEVTEANLGLFSEQREALVFHQALHEAVLPRLETFGLI
jgi:hypothetical protein